MFFITGKSQTAKGKYNQNNSIKFEKESIKSSLFGYSGALILVTWDIMVTADKNTDVAFKTSAPFLRVWQKFMICLLLKQITCNWIDYNDNHSDNK